MSTELYKKNHEDLGGKKKCSEYVCVHCDICAFIRGEEDYAELCNTCRDYSCSHCNYIHYFECNTCGEFRGCEKSNHKCIECGDRLCEYCAKYDFCDECSEKHNEQ